MRMFLYIITLLGYFSTILTHVTFTNLKCSSKDTKFLNFKKCYIKAVNRSHKYVDVHVSMYQIPVTNVTLKLKLMRHDHGYKPFFVDVTYDACKFLKNLKNPVLKLFYEIYKNSSNINHTCPYDHDLIVDHLWTGNMDSDFSKYIPIMNGDYAIFTEWSAYNIVRAVINLYIRISNSQ
ncbi:uncharacterized protein LOC128257035 [Drosophila gunungcola]|uniref:uncharacterized protein LOC128257035 n=1 Tax=Drosophila gunungcola TaxID=103775 RepID=UPI0022E1665A|nr:uncharacterized protein LOC128257035 [Drosophila gunungcola]